MKFYVNTELFDPTLETLLSIQEQLTDESATIEKVANNLRGQSISLDGIYNTLRNINNLIGEINLLVQKLKQIKHTYDDTENFILNVVNHLSELQEPNKSTQNITLYGLSFFYPYALNNHQNKYIKFVHPVSKDNYYSHIKSCLIAINLKEYSRVINMVLPLDNTQCEEWLKDKILVWMRENIQFSKGHTTYELPPQKIDLTDIFQ